MVCFALASCGSAECSVLYDPIVPVCNADQGKEGINYRLFFGYIRFLSLYESILRDCIIIDTFFCGIID